MKLFITTIILLFVLGTALPLAQGFTCPVDDCVISQCLYPNVENCRTFWQCSNGEPFLKQCPGGLLYNDFIKVCDWPSSQSCRPGLQPTTTTTTVRTTTKLTSTASPSTTTLTTTTTTQSPISSTASSGFVCPESDIANTGCKGPKDCLYPNPESCLNFIQCTVNADNKTGTPVVMPCAPSNPPLEWNDNKKECDWPSSSTCPSKPSTAKPSTAKPSTAQPPSPNVCSEAEIAATGCKGPKDCLYPNPDNCNSFIQCTVNADNKTGTPVVMPCPAGLEWNDNGKICDWPSNSTCPSKPSTAKPSTAQPSTAKPSTAQPSTAQPSTAQPPSPNVCSEAEIAATACKGPKDCLYPNPDNCNSFIQCTVNADNKTGTPVVMPCPAGLEWNDNGKICDWPSNSTCPSKPSTAQPSTAKPSTAKPSTAQPSTAQPSSTVPPSPNVCSEAEIAATGCKGPKDCLYPNPDNCNSFIQCTVNADNKTGTPVVMPCPAGLEWNDNDKICDWPSSSTCNKTSTPGSSRNPSPTPSGTTRPSTVPTCDANDGVDDSNLDLAALCGNDCPLRRLIANPNSQQRYIECNGGQNNNENSVKRCSLGLLFDSVNLTCNYAGLVNPYGPNSSN